ncbi:hypothetical protein LEN26_000781 [Aphanomyces euteiches]|nr:hypothetical protein AeMF1_003672 [Aphanomyces euteiches]KAH9162817.1 hypothetical protein LEN26_000781 [Aphanomyces euteiches]KAH9189268.1 hypothetical protein AeNC1_008755 [Aphanomyces euteiches]
MVPLAEIIVSACLIVSIFIFGLLIDLEAQRRIRVVRVAQANVNATTATYSQWPTAVIKTESPPCVQDETSMAFVGTLKTTLITPGSLYFRSLCETGSDAPSLTLKAKSISCRLWQELEAYLDRQFGNKKVKKMQQTCTASSLQASLH